MFSYPEPFWKPFFWTVRPYYRMMVHMHVHRARHLGCCWIRHGSP